MSATYRKLARARDFMRQRYLGPVSLADIAAHAHLSPYHFSRSYKQTFQETPHDFLTRLRIEKAKTLLRNGNLSVTEVCLEVGFESLSSFSGLFLREVGLPPSHYQKFARSSVYIPSIYRTLFVPSCFLLMLSGHEAQD